MQYSAKSSTSKKQKASSEYLNPKNILYRLFNQYQLQLYAQTCQAKEEEIQKEEFKQIKQSLVTKHRL
jgi:hypothetical protein